MNSPWNRRNADDGFTDFTSLSTMLQARKASGAERVIESKAITVHAYEDGKLGMTAGGAGAAELTNWSFGQLCSLARANASFLRKLPANLVVDPLNWCLANTASDQVKVLLARNGVWAARAITGKDYGRIYDADVVDDVLRIVGNDWNPPTTFDRKGRASKLYASDRDMHLTLVNETNPIEIPGKNGMDTLFRGLIIGHSEVSKCVLWIKKFLYRYSCSNRMIWQTEELGEIRIRHTKNAPNRWVNEVIPQLREFVNTRSAPILELVRQARRASLAVDHDALVTFLRSQDFTIEIATAAAERAEQNAEEADPRSVWGVVQALTSLAHDTPYQDDRIALETHAGRLMSRAA